MGCHDCKLTILSDRRDFLKAATLAAGSAMLVPLGTARCPGADDHVARPSNAVITVRGHHLFDMLGALGTGKSSHKTLGPVAQRVRANPKASIKVVIGVDDICGPCQWWDHQKARCTRDLAKYPHDNEDNDACDTNAIHMLGMKPGDTMQADVLYRLIKAKVTKKVFADKVCVACRSVSQCKETYEAEIAAAVKALG
jgi:hypothetical protein